MSEPTTAEVLIGPFVSDEGPAVIPMDRLIALRDYVTALQSRCERAEAAHKHFLEMTDDLEKSESRLQARVEELEAWQQERQLFPCEIRAERAEAEVQSADRLIAKLYNERDNALKIALKHQTCAATELRLEAEVQQLREALQAIRVRAETAPADWPIWQLPNEIVHLARAALSEEPRT